VQSHTRTRTHHKYHSSKQAASNPIEFTQETGNSIIGDDKKTHLLLFLDKTAADADSLISTLESAASGYEDKVCSLYMTRLCSLQIYDQFTPPNKTRLYCPIVSYRRRRAM